MNVYFLIILRLLINNKNANEKLLLNAFNIISNPSKKHNTPVLLKNDNIEISLSELEDNPNTFIPLKLDEIYFKTKTVTLCDLQWHQKLYT